MFKVIQKIMGDKQPMKAFISDIQFVVDRGIGRGDMRDEVYVQICKRKAHLWLIFILSFSNCFIIC